MQVSNSYLIEGDLAYHPKCDRVQANKILRNASVGSYVLRTSSKGNYALSMKFVLPVANRIRSKNSIERMGSDQQIKINQEEAEILHYELFISQDQKITVKAIKEWDDFTAKTAHQIAQEILNRSLSKNVKAIPLNYEAASEQA